VDFSSDGTVKPGPVNSMDLWQNEAPGVKNVTVGPSLLEFASVWRLGNLGAGQLSLSHKDGYTAAVWSSDGRQHLGPKSEGSTWEKPLVAADVAMGDRFVQLGSNWRIGDVDGKYMAIGYTLTQKSAVLYSMDGKMRAGPDAKIGLWDRKVLSSTGGQDSQNSGKGKNSKGSQVTPLPPQGFAWAPSLVDPGKDWPKKHVFDNDDGCTATFWYGFAYCNLGEKKRAVLSLVGYQAVSLKVGFGCPNAERMRTVLQGKVDGDAGPGCAAQYIKWDYKMQVQIERMARSGEAKALTSAFLLVLMQGASVHPPRPTGMQQFVPDRTFSTSNDDCNVTVAVQALGCTAPPRVPIMFSVRGNVYDKKMVGCGCSELIKAQIHGTIGWMKNTLPATQAKCEALHHSSMAEVRQLLSMVTKPVALLDVETELTLKIMSRENYHNPAWAAIDSCAKMNNEGWVAPALEEMHKEVEEKVYRTNWRVGGAAAKRRQLELEQLRSVKNKEQEAKRSQFGVERAAKQAKWDREKQKKSEAQSRT